MGVAKLRLFVAVELPPAVREHLRAVRESVEKEAPGIWWTREENLHITLKFLGDTAETWVKRLAAALATAGQHVPIHLRTEGLEFFPPAGDIRIISAGVAGDVTRLWALQDAVETICQDQGYARESRHYVPHITLARAKAKVRSSLRPVAEKLAAPLWPGPWFTVESFVLMQSILRAEGATYVPLERFPLTNQGPEKNH